MSGEKGHVQFHSCVDGLLKTSSFCPEIVKSVVESDVTHFTHTFSRVCLLIYLFVYLFI